jgi:hypothetical protein
VLRTGASDETEGGLACDVDRKREEGDPDDPERPPFARRRLHVL